MNEVAPDVPHRGELVYNCLATLASTYSQVPVTPAVDWDLVRPQRPALPP